MVLGRLKSGYVLKAALKRGTDGQILGMGPFMWYASTGKASSMMNVTVDTVFSMRSKGLIRVDDVGDWTQATPAE
jgi:hypothetical protein